MQKAISKIKEMPLGKKEILNFSQEINKALMNGDVDPLELALYFKSIEEIVKNVKPTMSELAVEEAQKYGKSFEFKGAKINVREMGTKYDYSNCGDVELEMIESNIAALNERRKERELILKAIKDSLILTNEETGETYKVYPPAKKSTTGIAITLK